jgi:serine/threonine protein kinase
MTSDPGETAPNLKTDNAKIPIETIRPPLKAGATFKGFEVLEVLGQGGMGVVYKARQQSLNRLVALKLLNSQLATSEEFGARFDREAKVLASLNHPNVVQVFDFGKEDGLLYLVMEHVDGPTLEDGMKKKGDPARFLSAVRDVARGLERVHQAGLVHRDVKPSNILMAKDGTAKISDFGLAIETERSQKLTQSGMFVGTPHYVSPEHAQGKKVDGRSDLYSLGVILFEGFAGRPPFQAPSATALLLKHVNEAPPALYKLAPQSPRAVQEIVRKLLAKNPAARHDTASSLARDLERAIEEVKAPKVPGTARKAPAPAPVPAPEPKKVPVKWIGAGVAAAAVIAILIAVLSGKPEPPKKDEKPAPVAVHRPVLPEPKKEPAAEPAPATSPNAPAPAPDLAPAQPPPTPAPRTPTAIEDAFREGEKLFEQARVAFEEGKTRSSVESLTDAAFKADAAKAKYAAVQEIGTDDLKAKAIEQVKLVQQFQKLVNESRLAILESKGINPAAPPVPAAGPEGRPAPAAVVPAPRVPAPAAGPGVRRVSVPNSTVQKDAEKQVRTLFKEDYAKKAPADAQALARKLLDLGGTVSSDEGARFVMLRDARDLAAQAGDLETAMKAVDLLSQSFEIEPVSSKVAVVNKAAPLMRGVEGMLLLSKAYLSIMEEGVASGQYDPAVTVASKAEGSAKASNDPILLSRIQSVSKDLTFLQRESASVRSAAKTLEQKPDDPLTNLSVGRFTCLGAGDWAKGLPLLAKGSDALLKAAAEKELAGGDDAAAGDAWWAAAEKERTAEYKKRMQARAARWYLSALPGAAGLVKVQMESRLKQTGGLLLPAAIATQRTEIVGGSGGASYDDHSRDGGILVGLRMNWADQGLQVLKSVQPLFSSGSSLQEGPMRGKPSGPFKESYAKPGYAVGGIVARGSNRVNGLRIVYMKIAGIGLDPRESYESEWFGDRGAGEVRLGSDGAYVLGICGGAFEDVDSLGLVLLRREAAAASGVPPAPLAVPAAKGKGVVDLLAAIDPKLDFVAGDFALDGSGLLTPPRVLRARVMVPYTPPTEYDFTMVVERKEGVNSLNYGVIWGGKLISLVVDGKGPAIEDAAGMDFIGGRPFFDNETTTKGPFLSPGKRSTVVTSVRKGSLTMTIDGRVVFSWKGDPSRVAENPAIAVPNKAAMTVGCYDSSFLISQLTVTPVSGQGTFLRKPPAAPAAGAGTPAPKGTLDLLALIDPQKDAVKGDWIQDGQGLTCSAGDHIRLQIPYSPPEEYDLLMTVDRREGSDGLLVGLVKGISQWSVTMDTQSSGSFKSGFESLDNQGPSGNATTYSGPVFTNGIETTLEFRVRKVGVTVVAGGKPIIEWRGNFNRLSLPDGWKVKSPNALFLAAWGSRYHFSRIVLVPVSGQGRKLR